MNIHIHILRLEIDKQERDRKLSAHESSVITLAQRSGENTAVDCPPVDKNELLRARLPTDTSSPDPAPNPESTVFALRNLQ